MTAKPQIAAIAGIVVAALAAGCAFGGVHAQGERLLQRGDYQGAADAYTQAIDANDHPVVAYANRCYAQGMLRQHEAAVNDCTKALDLMDEQSSDSDETADGVDLDRQRAEILNNRGVAYLGRRQFESAEADFSAAIDLDPNYAEAYANRGRALNEQDRYEAAIEDLDKALELDPTIAQAHGNLGAARTGLDEPEEALRQYAQAIELGAGSEALFDRASLLYALGCFRAAAKDYQAVVDAGDDEYLKWMAETQAGFLSSYEGGEGEEPEICQIAEE